MAKEENDATGQVVNDKGAEAQVTNEQGAEGQVATGESPAGGQQAQDGQQVPYTRFKEVNDAKKAAETEAQTLRDQMALMSTQAAQQPQKQEWPGLYKAVANQLGIDPEIATPDEQGQIFEGMMQVTSGQQSEQAFILSHPDYAEVVGVTGGNGQFQYAPPLIRALKANSALANAINNSPNKAVLAYAIASKDPQYLAEKAEKAKSADTKAAEKAEAKIYTANQQLSVSAAKGGGQLDEAARRAAQTNEEFLAENEKIMAKAL